MIMCAFVAARIGMRALWGLLMFIWISIWVSCTCAEWKWMSMCVSKIINRPQKRVIPLLCVRTDCRGPEEERICSHYSMGSSFFFFFLLRLSFQLDQHPLQVTRFRNTSQMLPFHHLPDIQECARAHARTHTVTTIQFYHQQLAVYCRLVSLRWPFLEEFLG